MKIICVGRNYAKHISELNSEHPDSPVLFLKPDSAVLPHKAPFYIPSFSNDVHYEVELLVKITKPGKCIEPEFANRYYDEIGLGIDFTARDIQNQLIAKGLPWEKAKGFDGSAVVGSFMNKNNFDSVDDIPFYLEKNGVVVQQSTSKNMLWKIDAIVSYISHYFTLKKGDLIFTGTPEGVGAVQSEDHLVGYINDVKMLQVHIK